MFPNLKIYYSTKDKYGNVVLGHSQRVRAVASQWEEMGGVWHDGKSCGIDNDPSKDIYYIDIHNDNPLPQLPLGAFTVCFSDIYQWTNNQINVLFSQCPIPENVSVNAKASYLGFTYFPRRPEYDGIPTRDTRQITLIPGGAGSIFFSKVDLMGIYDVAESYGYNVVILKDYTPHTAAEIVCNSSIVVSSASVSALEAISVGKPTIIVQTALDQEWLYNALVDDKYQMAIPYVSTGSIAFLIERPDIMIDYSYRGKCNISGNGAERICRAIIHEWRNQDGYGRNYC